MQKPHKIALVLLLVWSLLVSTAAGIPGCTPGCCMQDTHQTDKAAASLTAPPAHACCCSASKGSPPCHLTETSTSVTDTYLPASNGLETPSQQELKATIANATIVVSASCRTASASNPVLYSSLESLYLQLQSFLC